VLPDGFVGVEAGSFPAVVRKAGFVGKEIERGVRVSLIFLTAENYAAVRYVVDEGIVLLSDFVAVFWCQHSLFGRQIEGDLALFSKSAEWG